MLRATIYVDGSLIPSGADPNAFGTALARVLTVAHPEVDVAVTFSPGLWVSWHSDPGDDVDQIERLERSLPLAIAMLDRAWRR